MVQPEHPIHSSTEASRAQLVQSLAEIVFFNERATGIARLSREAPEVAEAQNDIFDEPPMAVVLAGEVAISDRHPYNKFILTQVVAPIPGDPRDAEYTLRTHAPYGRKHEAKNLYRDATFRVCTHQGHFQLEGSRAEQEMRPSSYDYVSSLLAGATFDSELRTRRALKQLTEDGVIGRITHKPRVNWVRAYFRMWRYAERTLSPPEEDK
jgi:hypothetical protein